jgi:hypothetical protein
LQDIVVPRGARTGRGLLSIAITIHSSDIEIPYLPIIKNAGLGGNY